MGHCERHAVGEEGQHRIIAWVGSEILPHEADLRLWLRRIVGDNEVEDIVQETYCRLASLADVRHIRNGRAYFFQAAKSIVIDRVRRSRVVSIETVAEIDAANVVHDEPNPERIAGARRELARVQRLIAGLPDRCRRIVELRKIDGLPQREVARIMEVPETIVENDVVKGLRLILQAIAQEEIAADLALGNVGNNERRDCRYDQ